MSKGRFSNAYYGNGVDRLGPVTADQEKLWNDNIKLVISATNYIRRPANMSYSEVKQVALIAMLRAVQLYNPAKGKLSTLFYFLLSQEISRASAFNRGKDHAVNVWNFNNYPDPKSDEGYERVDNEDALEQVWRLWRRPIPIRETSSKRTRKTLKNLPKTMKRRQRFRLRRLRVLADYLSECLTFEQISIEEGVSKAAVGQQYQTEIVRLQEQMNK